MPNRARVLPDSFPKTPLTNVADVLLHEANGKLDKKRKSAMGQFMTSSPISSFMATLFKGCSGNIELLDAGAGVGSLTAAFVQRCCEEVKRPESIRSTVYEVEAVMLPYLSKLLNHCREACEEAGIAFESNIRADDFIAVGRHFFEETLFATREKQPLFSHAILNPPYKKIRSDGEHRLLLRSIGIETGNLYAAFVAIALKMLRPGGELVAITPRSFCNGPYFKPFRRLLLETAAIERIHVFESRDKAFAHDEVLQENIIFHLIKGADQGQVVISSSEQADSYAGMTVRQADFNQIVKPDDPDIVIHVTPDERSVSVEQRIKSLPCTLRDLGVEVSTGPVVDFRLKEYLRMEPEEGTFPLIYATHCENGFVSWPQQSRKPNAIANCAETAKWLYPNGWYTLTRRFSSKEEKRRIVATVHDPGGVPGERIGFENHLNLFHGGKKGLTPALAKGLAVFLNSSLIDDYFRQFSGHTQVNATDLRMFRYPRCKLLEEWGSMVIDTFPSQEEIDNLVEKEMTDEQKTAKAA
jgi:adenine-specific DNA-methyltransferase